MVLLASMLAAGAASVVAAVVTPWALVVLPVALVTGVCAWRRVPLAKAWAALDATSDDPGRGPAGVAP